MDIEKNYIIDTHCHLNVIDKRFEEDINENNLEDIKRFIEDAKANGIKKIINVGTSFIESKNSIKIADRFDNIYASIGIHPNDLNNNWANELEILKNSLNNKKIVAIGECGLDKHYKDYDIKKQTKAFIKHIEIALEKAMPLIIHTRDAFNETLDIIKIFKNEFQKYKPGVIHCFSGDLNFANHVIEAGFAIGITANITYPKNVELKKVVKDIPLENIILETDAPFLPPQNMRGEKNYPKNLKFVAESISLIKEIELYKVQFQTAKNSENIFNLK
jgi:TatD DNase family protein